LHKSYSASKNSIVKGAEKVGAVPKRLFYFCKANLFFNDTKLEIVKELWPFETMIKNMLSV